MTKAPDIREIVARAALWAFEGGCDRGHGAICGGDLVGVCGCGADAADDIIRALDAADYEIVRRVPSDSAWQPGAEAREGDA